MIGRHAVDASSTTVSGQNENPERRGGCIRVEHVGETGGVADALRLHGRGERTCLKGVAAVGAEEEDPLAFIGEAGVAAG